MGALLEDKGYVFASIPGNNGTCVVCGHDYDCHWFQPVGDMTMCMPEEGWCECQGYSWE